MAYAQAPEQSTTLSQMNITPLVDVMLVLLIIFMIATPLMTSRIKIALPATDRGKQETSRPLPPPVTVSVTEAGGMFFNDTPVTRERLEAYFAIEAQKAPQPDVHIRGDKTAPYRYINEVLGIAQAQGMRRVGFVSVKDRH